MTECPSVSKQPRMFTSCPPAGLCLTSTSTFDIESEAEILVNEPHDFSADLVGIFDRLIGIKASLGPQRDANGATSPPFCCLVFIEISFYDFQYKI